jgi:hypothetical protein
MAGSPTGSAIGRAPPSVAVDAGDGFDPDATTLFEFGRHRLLDGIAVMVGIGPPRPVAPVSPVSPKEPGMTMHEAPGTQVMKRATIVVTANSGPCSA